MIRNVQVSQISVLSPRCWRVLVRGDGPDRETTLEDPFQLESDDKEVRWYLEDYADEPFTKNRAVEVAAKLRRYGESLWDQLGFDSASPFVVPSSRDCLVLSVIISVDHQEIDRLHWEVLENLENFPYCIEIRRELRDATVPPTPSIPENISAQHSDLKILVVCARSSLKNKDLSPRLTSLPLLQTLGQNQAVELEFVHSGTFADFENALDNARADKKPHLVHFDLHGRVHKEKGPVLEFYDPETGHRIPQTASTIANVLRRNGVKWVVLCACRTAQTMSKFGHLAQEFLKNGIQGIFAMRFQLKATAARILTSAFYSALCQDGKTFVEAAHSARQALKDDPFRPASFGEMVQMQDSMVPAMYTSHGADFCLTWLQQQDDSPSKSLHEPMPLPELVGREDDIRDLSKLMKEESTFTIVHGDVGAGKSLLMRHLAWWWKETKLFARVIYVDVSLTRRRLDKGVGVLALIGSLWRFTTGRTAPKAHNAATSDNSVGLLALARHLWRSVAETNDEDPHTDTIKYLRDAIEATKGQDCIILLDGIDELYHASSASDDTVAQWAEFFRVAKLLSTTGSKLVVATCAPSLCAESGTPDCVLELSDSMTVADACKILDREQLNTSRLSTSQEAGREHLQCVLELLQYNPTALQSLSSVLRGKFQGLETFFSCKFAFAHDDDVGMRSFPGQPVELRNLARTNVLMLTIMAYLVRHYHYQEFIALLTFGQWIDVLPHPQAIANSFDLESKVPLWIYLALMRPYFEYVVKPQLATTSVPFELWSILKAPLPPSEYPAHSESAIKEALQNVIRLLLAAGLLTGRSGTLIDGNEGYRIHPLFALWVRTYLRGEGCTAVPVEHAGMVESRAKQMTALNDTNLAQLALEERSFDFVKREKWNLLAAIAALHYPPCSRCPAQRSFAWNSFAALAPIYAGKEDSITWFLTHVALQYAETIAPLVPTSHEEPLPDPLEKMLFILNWVISMTQRFKLDYDNPVPLQLRRLLLARIEAIRESGVAVDETHSNGVVAAEIRARYNEFTLASRSPNFTQEDMNRMREKMKSSIPDSFWRSGDKGSIFLYQRMSTIDLDGPISAEVLEQYRRDVAGLPTGYYDTYQALCQTENDYQSILDNTVDSPIVMFWMKEVKELVLRLDFLRSLPPTYMPKWRSILLPICKGNLQLAAKAARKAIQDCERDGNVLVASRFRQICHLINDLDPSDDYAAHQRLLEQVIAGSDNITRYPLTSLVDHNTPEAYTAWSFGLSCMKIFTSGVAQFENNPVGAALSLEGMEQLLKLLEPYKDKKLEDKGRWVYLMKEIWKIIPKIRAEVRLFLETFGRMAEVFQNFASNLDEVA